MKRNVKFHGGTELPLESSFGHLMRSIHRLQAQLLQSRLSQDGISLGCWYFLRVLWVEDMITQRELSLRTGVNQATTRTAVDRMEAEKLVNRRSEPTDRRKRLIRLTPRARELEPCLIRFADDLNNRILDRLSEQEKKGFLIHLAEIYDHIRTLAPQTTGATAIDRLD